MEEESKDNNIVIFNCKIDSTLRDNFKIKTIKEQTTMADVVIDAIKKYVGEN